jgi:hypothetical protein
MIINSKCNGNRIIELSHSEQQKIHWLEFDDSTRIGWRGPIMLWTDVINGMDVYWSL